MFFHHSRKLSLSEFLSSRRFSLQQFTDNIAILQMIFLINGNKLDQFYELCQIQTDSQLSDYSFEISLLDISWVVFIVEAEFAL